jgi:hypothetical protein
MRKLEEFADSESYDLFYNLIGKELVSTRSSGPIRLREVIIPKCYDIKFLKKHGRMIRLVLSIKYSDKEVVFGNDYHESYNEHLDLPFSLIESWSLKKMKNWAIKRTKQVREKEIERLQDEIIQINKKLEELKKAGDTKK